MGVTPKGGGYSGTQLHITAHLARPGVGEARVVALERGHPEDPVDVTEGVHTYGRVVPAGEQSILLSWAGLGHMGTHTTFQLHPLCPALVPSDHTRSAGWVLPPRTPAQPSPETIDENLNMVPYTPHHLTHTPGTLACLVFNQ